jgi:hypothetical protein
LAENSYLPKYCSMRKGEICMRKVSQVCVAGVQHEIRRDVGKASRRGRRERMK